MDPQCCGITSRGQRCKKRTKDYSTSYKIPLPTCRYHKTKNWIYEWSLNNVGIPPEIVLEYLHNLYKIQKENSTVHPLLCVMMTTYAYPMTDTTDFMPSLFDVPEHVEECPICFENSYLQYNLKRCKHGFCWGCITKWIRESPTCPMCRKNVFKL